MSVSSWIRRQFKNAVSVTDTIPTGMSSGALSFTAADGSTFPDGSIGSFIVTVDQGLSTEEKILCASRSGAVFTVASGGRGYNGGGAAQAHGANATLLHTIDQQDMDEANQVAVATLGAISASGDLLQGTGAHALARLARGAANTFLQVQGTSLGYVAFGSGGTTAIASSGADGTSTSPARYDHTHSGVTSVNGVAGAVTAANILSAVEAAFGSANQIVLGTGSATGTLATLANGYGITGFAANPPTPAVSLSNAAGHLASPYTVTGSLATFMTTASLGVGTWEVKFGANLSFNSSAAGVEITTAVGTATATFEGKYSAESDFGIAGVDELSLTFIATVTVAGTLVFQAIDQSASNSTINSVTTITSKANATGYTAVRIA